MKCPVCKDIDLAMTDRQGIEIDYCPRCRGIWLDRGELDRLIDRAEASERTSAAPPPPPAYDPRNAPREYPPQAAYGQHGHYKKKHHKSLLGELFDF